MLVINNEPRIDRDLADQCVDVHGVRVPAHPQFAFIHGHAVTAGGQPRGRHARYAGSNNREVLLLGDKAAGRGRVRSVQGLVLF